MGIISLMKRLFHFKSNYQSNVSFIADHGATTRRLKFRFAFLPIFFGDQHHPFLLWIERRFGVDRRSPCKLCRKKTKRRMVRGRYYCFKCLSIAKEIEEDSFFEVLGYS